MKSQGLKEHYNQRNGNAYKKCRWQSPHGSQWKQQAWSGVIFTCSAVISNKDFAFSLLWSFMNYPAWVENLLIKRSEKGTTLHILVNKNQKLLCPGCSEGQCVHAVPWLQNRFARIVNLLILSAQSRKRNSGTSFCERDTFHHFFVLSCSFQKASSQNPNFLYKQFRGRYLIICSCMHIFIPWIPFWIRCISVSAGRLICRLLWPAVTPQECPNINWLSLAVGMAMWPATDRTDLRMTGLRWSALGFLKVWLCKSVVSLLTILTCSNSANLGRSMKTMQMTLAVWMTEKQIPGCDQKNERFCVYRVEKTTMKTSFLGSDLLLNLGVRMFTGEWSMSRLYTPCITGAVNCIDCRSPRI